MESMEEEMRRCSEHLQRRQSKRSFDRTLNGFTRAGRSDEMNGGEEAGARYGLIEECLTVRWFLSF